VHSIVPGAHDPHDSVVAHAPSAVLSIDDARLGAVVEPEGLARCPRCHRVDEALTNASVAAGEYWRCARCGSSWDQARLATVAAYTAWDLARQQRQRPDEGLRVGVGTVGRGAASA
jgi:hypothetical protein